MSCQVAAPLEELLEVVLKSCLGGSVECQTQNMFMNCSDLFSTSSRRVTRARHELAISISTQFGIGRGFYHVARADRDQHFIEIPDKGLRWVIEKTQ